MKLNPRPGSGGINLCGNCHECCHDMKMSLTEEERVWMQNAGNTITLTPDEQLGRQKPPKGRKFYSMAGACALIDQQTGLCMAHEDPTRPAACEEITPGSGGCRYIRSIRLPQESRRPVPLPMPTVISVSDVPPPIAA